MALVYLLVLAVLARWLISAWQGGNPELGARNEAEVRRLRGEVDALATEVRRLSEEQSFMVRLLAEGAERPREEALPPAPEPETPNPENS